MPTDYVLIETGDISDGENIASLIGHPNFVDMVHPSHQFTVQSVTTGIDSSVEISGGKAFIGYHGTLQTTAGEDRREGGFTVEKGSAETVELAQADGSNYLWLDAEIEQGRGTGPTWKMTSSNTQPAEGSLLIAEFTAIDSDPGNADTNAETITLDEYHNRRPTVLARRLDGASSAIEIDAPSVTLQGDEISPDTNEDAHHDRYTDSEVESVIQSALDIDPETGTVEGTIEVFAGNGINISSDGEISIVGSDIAHGDLDAKSINSDDHHSKTTSASELTDVSADSDSDAHHSKTASASELTDVSADSDSDAHHSKTESASELTDVSPDSESDAHHSKTESASELTDVSPDSESDAHHTKYSDTDAKQAVADGSLNGLTYDLSSDTVEISRQSTLEVNSNEELGVVESEISHDNLSEPSISTDDHHTRYTDGEAIDAVGNTLQSGLIYDSANDIIDVATANPLTINSSGRVSLAPGELSPVEALGTKSGYIISGCEVIEKQFSTETGFKVTDGKFVAINEATGLPELYDFPGTDGRKLSATFEGTSRIYIIADDGFSDSISDPVGDLTLHTRSPLKSGDPPASTYLKIGEFVKNGDSGTARGQFFRKESDGTLSFPDENAIDASDSTNNIPVGTTVLDRQTSAKYVITS